MSELKQRVPSTKLKSSDSDSNPDPISTPVPPTRPSKAQRLVSQTLASTAYLANLLPTGTLLAFQLLTPIFTNNGQCDTATRSMTAVLLAILAISCFLASFTDSIQGPDGQVYYGFAIFKEMWLFDYPDRKDGELDLAKYKLRLIDWIHAVLSVLVFGVWCCGFER